MRRAGEMTGGVALAVLVILALKLAFWGGVFYLVYLGIGALS